MRSQACSFGIFEITIRPGSLVQWLGYHQYGALYPDTETPFADAPDAVNRLLPYHIFQHPREDLDGLATRPVFSKKGKGKASKADLLREEIAGGFSAPSCSHSHSSGLMVQRRDLR